jgi:hypothetical protein
LFVTTAGQSLTEDEFVERQFVHESGHGVGEIPNADEEQVIEDQKNLEKEPG